MKIFRIKPLRFILILSLILTIFMGYLQPLIVYASLVGNAASESGHAPAAATPADAGGGSYTPTPGYESGTKTITRTWYRNISGNVFETDGNFSEVVLESTDKPVEGVKVEASAGGGVEDATYTEADGSYLFENLPAGEYTINFKYGDTNDTSNIKNALKYNGHDYEVSYLGKPGYKVLNSVEEEVVNSRGSALQFVIVLDCSISAQNTNVTCGGITTKRLNVEIEATKKLINNLLTSGDNIYIGLVAFSGDGYIAASLTKDEGYLDNILDTIRDDPTVNVRNQPNTNIKHALYKAVEAFYYDDVDANRAIVLVSDGIPTKYYQNDEAKNGAIQTYCDYSDTDNYNILVDVKHKTIEKIEEIVDSDIKIMSLIVESDEPDERDWVDEIYDRSGVEYHKTQDGDALAEAIMVTVQDWLDDIIDDAGALGSLSCENRVAYGYEHPYRRYVVDSQFRDFYNAVDYTVLTDETVNTVTCKKYNILTLNLEPVGTYNKDEIILDRSNKRIYQPKDSYVFYYANQDPENISNVIDIDNLAGQVNVFKIIDAINDDILTNAQCEALIEEYWSLISRLGNELYMTASNGTYHIDGPGDPPFESVYTDDDGTTYELDSISRDEDVHSASYKEFSMEMVDYEVPDVDNPAYDADTNPITKTVSVEEKVYGSKTLNIVYYICTHTNVDMGITLRNQFLLTPRITATALKITLSDGSVLPYKQVNELGETEYLDYQSVEPESDKMLYQCIDSDIAQGATLEVEYTITLKNSSDYTCNHLEVLVYIPSELQFSDTAQLFTDPTHPTNASLGWIGSNSDKLTCKNEDGIVGNGKISSLNKASYKEMRPVILNLDENITGEKQVKLVVSRFLSSEDIVTIEDEATVEILGYTNTGARRAMTRKYETDDSIFIGVFPGNTYIKNKVEISEVDWDKCSNKLAIVPPTGLKENTVAVSVVKELISKNMGKLLSLRK